MSGFYYLGGIQQYFEDNKIEVLERMYQSKIITKEEWTKSMREIIKKGKSK
jgi:uncharacterized protein YqgQ